jgi:hypothetical protein
MRTFLLACGITAIQVAVVSTLYYLRITERIASSDWVVFWLPSGVSAMLIWIVVTHFREGRPSIHVRILLSLLGAVLGLFCALAFSVRRWGS